MFLYNLTLQNPTFISQVVVGNFSGSKHQEIILAKGTFIELYSPDVKNGHLNLVLKQNIFGVIRSMLAFKLAGTSKDYLIAGSDSGRIVVLEYNPAKKNFEKVQQETFGKSGCRRMVPGQYLAMDARGRAVMIEKQKFVYILNRDSEQRLTISSPLEAHKSHTNIFFCVGLDVEFANPIFACLEVDHSESDLENGPPAEALDKHLVYYELDLGLNHVVRKWSEPVDYSANYLIPVPGGSDGPSGVLVCSENFITWKHQDHPEFRVPIPRRHNSVDDKVLITAAASHKTKTMFFILAHTEEGDIFKITVDLDVDRVTGLKIKYFDTISPSASLAILKSGYLFSASEQGPHAFYQIVALGDNDDEPAVSSGEATFAFFSPRELRNLLLTDKLNNMAPLLDAKVISDQMSDHPSIYCLAGGDIAPSLEMLKYGVKVKELALTELPAPPTGIWTVKRTIADLNTELIIVSFVNASIVLSVGETIEELAETVFTTNTCTIHVEQFSDSSIVQVTLNGFKHLKADRNIFEWSCPKGKTVKSASGNDSQLALVLSGGILVYFELDFNGYLIEAKKPMELECEIICCCISPVPSDQQRSKFLSVSCNDQTVRVFSLLQDNLFESLSLQVLASRCNSLLSVDFKNEMTSSLYLFIGLDNGVLIRLEVDESNGSIAEPLARYLGIAPVKLCKLQSNCQFQFIALSSRPWAAEKSSMQLVPLAFEGGDPAVFSSAASLVSEQVSDGIISACGSSLRIFYGEQSSSKFHGQSLNLNFIPRKLAYCSELALFGILETSHKMFTPAAKGKYDQAIDPIRIRSDFRAPKGNWASCLKLVEPSSYQINSSFNFDENEAAFSIEFCNFATRPGQHFVVVGSVKDFDPDSKSFSSAYLSVFQISRSSMSLDLLHKTAVEDIPYSLCSFQGRLLAGVGRLIRIYDIGMKKLLRKCENKGLPNAIVTIHCQGNRIIVGDIQESCHYLIYKPPENIMVIFADDVIYRWITTTCQLDYDTVAGGDKFGNFFVIRIPEKTSEEIDLDPTGLRISERGYLMGAPNKLERMVDFFLGDIITSLQKVNLTRDGREVLFYTTILGGLGVMVPFFFREDVAFFQTLEMHMRNESQPLFGREHLSFRSTHIPVKNIIDGDLCEQYSTLGYEKKREIALSMDKSPKEIQRKLEEFRLMNAY